MIIVDYGNEIVMHDCVVINYGLVQMIISKDEFAPRPMVIYE